MTNIISVKQKLIALILTFTIPLSVTAKNELSSKVKDIHYLSVLKTLETNPLEIELDKEAMECFNNINSYQVSYDILLAKRVSEGLDILVEKIDEKKTCKEKIDTENQEIDEIIKSYLEKNSCQAVSLNNNYFTLKAHSSFPTYQEVADYLIMTSKIYGLSLQEILCKIKTTSIVIDINPKDSDTNNSIMGIYKGEENTIILYLPSIHKNYTAYCNRNSNIPFKEFMRRILNHEIFHFLADSCNCNDLVYTGIGNFDSYITSLSGLVEGSTEALRSETDNNDMPIYKSEQTFLNLVNLAVLWNPDLQNSDVKDYILTSDFTSFYHLLGIQSKDDLLETYQMFYAYELARNKDQAFIDSLFSEPSEDTFYNEPWNYMATQFRSSMLSMEKIFLKNLVRFNTVHDLTLEENIKILSLYRFQSDRALIRYVPSNDDYLTEYKSIENIFLSYLETKYNISHEDLQIIQTQFLIDRDWDLSLTCLKDEDNEFLNQVGKNFLYPYSAKETPTKKPKQYIRS